MNDLKNSPYRKIAVTSMLFALSSVLVILQIPVYLYLNIDFSIFPILMCLMLVGYKYAFFLSVSVPWVAMLSYLPTDIVGALILCFVNITVITIYWMCKNFNVWTKFIITTFVSTFIITIANIFLFTPWYYGFDYSLVLDAFWYYFGLYTWFNVLKISINVILFELTHNKLKKVL